MVGQKGNFNIAVILLIGVVVIGAAFYIYQLISSQSDAPNSPQSIPTSSPSPNQEVDLNGWERTTNTGYGFIITHPSGSTRTSDGKGYIRLQNYTDEELAKSNYKLLPGQYYLEIIISEPILKSENSESCEEMLNNPREIEVNGIKGLRGYAKGEGDSAKYMPSICINKESYGYFIRASEEYQVVGEKIIDSFKFTN